MSSLALKIVLHHRRRINQRSSARPPLPKKKGGQTNAPPPPLFHHFIGQAENQEAVNRPRRRILLGDPRGQNLEGQDEGGKSPAIEKVLQKRPSLQRFLSLLGTFASRRMTNADQKDERIKGRRKMLATTIQWKYPTIWREEGGKLRNRVCSARGGREGRRKEMHQAGGKDFPPKIE